MSDAVPFAPSVHPDRGISRRWSGSLLALLSLAALWASTLALTSRSAFSGQDEAAAPGELQLKAVFVLNFIRFVNWSNVPQYEPGADITICALANSDFAAAVRRITAGKTVGGRSIRFRFEPSPDPVRCRVLIVDAAEYSTARPALNAVRNAPVLTIGNGPGLIAMGGIFDLLVEDRRVLFDANPEGLRRAAIDVNTRVLRMSRNLRNCGSFRDPSSRSSKSPE